MIKLGESTAKSIINAPVESIDLGAWMFTLTSEEYAACAEGHQSAAQGKLPSGKRVSVNVEFVAGYFMIQHYIEHTAKRNHVVGISPNTLMWINDEIFVLTQITWELKVEKLDDNSTELTCNVIAETENHTFAQQAHEATENLKPEEIPFQIHIDEETPNFAKDIERKALSCVWN